MEKKQVAVIGLGRFGVSTTRTLYNLGHDVLAIDRDEDRVQAVLGRVTYAIGADCTNENALRDLAVPDYDAAIVAIGTDIVSSVMASVLLKTMGVKLVAISISLIISLFKSFLTHPPTNINLLLSS